MWKYLAFLGLCLVAGVQSAATPESSYYTAGVVEFRPNFNSADSLNEHLDAYISIVASAEASETDIIVFPEGTLNNVLQASFVPAAAENIIPCDAGNNYADFLIKLSCVARTARKYLVINLTEKENCIANANVDPRPCADNGLNIYNTNVVFDREGRVISRYRKTHLYNENKNTTYEPELGTFETDFGVKFGHFICFDLLFYTPAEEMVREHNINNFILTTMFYSELPFLTAAQLQQGWAWGNNVNLLAAGASYPENGVTGTGIYAGSKGDLLAVMTTGTGVRKLYVSQVPKTITTSRQTRATAENAVTYNVADTDIKLMQDPNITDFLSKQINTAAEMTYGQLCMNGFCCVYNMTMERKDDKIERTPYYEYRVGVFSGKRSFGSGDTNDVRICALYACLNETESTCGQLIDMRTQSGFRFKSLELSARLVKNEYMLIMPSTLNDNLLPLKAINIDWRVDESSAFYDVHINSTTAQDNLLTFGIYAQYYEEKTGNGASLNMATAALLWGGIVAVLWRQFSMI